MVAIASQVVHHETPVDPLHRVSGPETAWTRVNIAEGIPGVSTPLGWSWWDDANEYMIRGAYHDLGVLGSVEIPDVRDVDRRASAIFYGRPALNVDVSRALADLQPGTSGEALERHYFGAVRPDAPSSPSRRRYPVIAFKLPVQWWRVPAQLDRLYAQSHAWWQSTVAKIREDGVATAHARLAEARTRAATIARPHSTLALLGGALIQQVSAVADRAGRPELVLDALGGYDSIEFETLDALLAVKRGDVELESFLAERGYQGPLQGEISSRSWREDPTPIRSILASLDPNDTSIGEVARERAQKRAAAEAGIVDALPRAYRPWARWLFAQGARMLPSRETGKAGMMLGIDVARACARGIGADYAARDLLDDPEDVFYLTLDELRSEPPAGARDRVESRRRDRERYLELELPESWIGQVEPIVRASEPASGPLEGLGVSPGSAEGIVRVVHHGAGHLEPGEILVCEATDPSYAAYFLVAAGVITEIGGAMGHGAIVAREVGIPCVANARDATRRLSTGDRVRIDGTTGKVEILSQSGAPE